jgi:predicted nuclease with TOPRIM domain
LQPDEVEQIKESLSYHIGKGKEMVDDLDNRDKKLKKQAGLIKDLEAEISKLNKDNEQLKEDGIAFNSTGEQLKESLNKANELGQQLQRYKDENDKLNEELKEIKKENADLKSNFDKMQSELIDKKQDYIYLTEDYNHLHSELEAYDEEKKEFEAAQAKAAKETRSHFGFFKSTNNQQAAKSISVKFPKVEYDESLKLAREQVNKLKNEVGMKQMSIDNLTNQLTALKLETEELNAKTNDACQLAAAQEEQLKKDAAEIAELKTKVTNLGKEIETAEKSRIEAMGNCARDDQVKKKSSQIM